MKPAWLTADLLGRALRYGVVGVLGVAIFYATLPYLRDRLGLPSFVAGVMCSAIAGVVNYVANYFWAFRSDRPHSIAGPRYALVMICNLTANGLGVWWMVDHGHLPYWQVTLYLALTLPLVNFVLFNWWAFRDGS